LLVFLQPGKAAAGDNLADYSHPEISRQPNLVSAQYRTEFFSASFMMNEDDKIGPLLFQPDDHPHLLDLVHFEHRDGFMAFEHAL
jgi:hypothetical protein